MERISFRSVINSSLYFIILGESGGNKPKGGIEKSPVSFIGLHTAKETNPVTSRPFEGPKVTDPVTSAVFEGAKVTGAVTSAP